MVVTSAASAAPAAVPTWLRAAAVGPGSLEDAAFAAAAALTALDAVVRRQARWAGAWRHRLALTAAAVTAKLAGRVEDEAVLRDAVLLTRAGDDVGPAGRMLLAWRRLAARPAEDLLSRKNIAAVLEEFDHAHDDEAVSDLVDELKQLAAKGGTVGVLTGAFMAVERCGFDRILGAWLADALLAQRLGWIFAMPLLGGEAALGAGAARRRRDVVAGVSPAETQADRAKSLLVAQARAALRAIDLFAELDRRSERLLVVAPKLRARASDLVVERLLSDDAIVASEQIAGMSDRGLRRLFDRLVELGAVRELSGRPTFRIYGL
ncbi:DUF1403 family protein [Aminobacter sp. MDW-2]|uniref:DUF1403 family protein n=1 Tax=Aminobacter sp. MDW-2 TaxID=2666139 RepID=UPI0012B1415E|nr:DUF1403 family protein [Aminobacter sp. MDW-2]MRX36932.1 DUF1403 family protein [Aminobacter sp. MDW-2]QNH37952.1 DUF1403 family protein [Aminobacter sp. MDW-2]